MQLEVCVNLRVMRISTGRFPDRKRVALCWDEGPNHYVLAYFQSELAAQKFEEFMRHVAKLKEATHE